MALPSYSHLPRPFQCTDGTRECPKLDIGRKGSGYSSSVQYVSSCLARFWEQSTVRPFLHLLLQVTPIEFCQSASCFQFNLSHMSTHFV